MKALLLSSLFLCFSYTTYCQKIHFTDAQNTWQDIGMDGDGNQYHPFYKFTGDTTIKGTSYKMMSNNYALREDTLAGIVYLRDKDTDRVLYNYNLKPGDTISRLLPLNSSLPVQSRIDSVTYVDSILINAVYHKIFYMSGRLIGNSHTQFYYTVVEGIGTPNGPLGGYFVYNFEGNEYLICFERQDQKPAISLLAQNNYGRMDSFVNCAHLNIDDIKHNAGTIKAVPNPGNNSSLLMLPYTVASGTFIILNSVGQVISRYTFANSRKLPIGEALFISGLYIYKVVDNTSGQAFTGKFMFSK